MHFRTRILTKNATFAEKNILLDTNYKVLIARTLKTLVLDTLAGEKAIKPMVFCTFVAGLEESNQ